MPRGKTRRLALRFNFRHEDEEKMCSTVCQLLTGLSHLEYGLPVREVVIPR